MQPGLPRVGRGDRRRKPHALGERRARRCWPAHNAQTDDGQQRTARDARSAAPSRPRPTEGPIAARRYSSTRTSTAASGGQRDDPEPRRCGEHDRDVRDEPQIPEQIDLAAVRARSPSPPRSGRGPATSQTRASHPSARRDSGPAAAQRRAAPARRPRARSTAARASGCPASARRSRTSATRSEEKSRRPIPRTRRHAVPLPHASIIAYQAPARQPQRVDEERVAQRDADRAAATAVLAGGTIDRRERDDQRGDLHDADHPAAQRRRQRPRHPRPQPSRRDEEVAQQARRQDPRPRLADTARRGSPAPESAPRRFPCRTASRTRWPFRCGARPSRRRRRAAAATMAIATTAHADAGVAGWTTIGQRHDQQRHEQCPERR